MKTQASSMNIWEKEHSREREQRKAQRRDRMPDLAGEQQGHRGWNRGDEGRVVRGQGNGREKEKWDQVTHGLRTLTLNEMRSHGGFHAVGRHDQTSIQGG